LSPEYITDFIDGVATKPTLICSSGFDILYPKTFYKSIFSDGLAKKNTMAKQKFRPTRRSSFSGAKAYIRYVEILKNCCNAGGRTFCDAIFIGFIIRTNAR